MSDYTEKRRDIQEYNRVQRWMRLVGKDSPAYPEMLDVSNDLRAALVAGGSIIEENGSIRE